MHPNEFIPQEGRRHRRQFSSQAKADIVAECQQRGVSVAAVARAHDLHPNLLRKWVQAHERFGSDEVECEPAARRLRWERSMGVARLFTAVAVPGGN